MPQKRRPEKIFLTLIAVLGWFALIAQFYVIIENRTMSIAATIIMYFSFFTILTNLIVAIASTCIVLTPHHFFAKPATLTAITVYILIVGIVYNIILRFLWNPMGLQRVADELLHTVVPVLFLLFWILFVKKNDLKWKNAFFWLLYPALYSVYILIRGEFTKLYPYPFVDINKIGYEKALTNASGIFIAFLTLSLLLIAIGKMSPKKP